jgi:hypothetical protein
MDHQQAIFFIQQIRDANFRTFFSAAKQLFQYLEEKAKDNVEYIKYSTEIKKWEGWLNRAIDNRSESIPDDFNEAKSLGFSLYYYIAKNPEESQRLIFLLFVKRDVDDNLIEFNRTFLEYFNKSLEDIFRVDTQPKEEMIEKNIVGNKIFIVHGLDNELKREVQLFVERCDLDSVVLHECPSKGRTIIDKLIEESMDACYIIALLSPDDELADGNNRARQNVILEIGYFLGRLGKSKVRMLKKGEVEIPSDLHGILYTDFDARGAWKIELAKELNAVGISVDGKKVIEYF